MGAKEAGEARKEWVLAALFTVACFSEAFLVLRGQLVGLPFVAPLVAAREHIHARVIML
ncbi:hypothetical protein [Cupriavidus sp. UYPR2.512]|uniref:hypothetical protein n=1 Tax=Cupriavidus sp. UYPR2.512 TaxID=1080187 RepID=UPI00035D959C|nr:hypothetical protein [Cupriavidus sp. UYPR2.512]UIF84716.1 hypothetical protein KAF44_10630 [Cupriavidus necator]